MVELSKLYARCFKEISFGMGFLYDWWEERFEIQSIAYCFGGIMLTSFIFQAGSGFALTIYYQPTVVEAFPSSLVIRSYGSHFDSSHCKSLF